MDPETLRWLLTAVAIPAGLGLWALITRVIIPYYQKEATVSSASARERDRSLQVFGETQAGRAQDRSNDIQDKLVAFLLASNDGKISEILDTSKGGTAQVVSLILRVSAEQAATSRHHKLLLLILAGLVELGEHVNQSTVDTQDLVHAVSDLMSSQVGNINDMEAVADKNAGARTVIQNLKVWLAEDSASIADFLNFVNPVRLTDAARTMQPGRVIEVMQALQDGLRGK